MAKASTKDDTIKDETTPTTLIKSKNRHIKAEANVLNSAKKYSSKWSRDEHLCGC